MAQDSVELHSNYLLTIPLLGAILIFSLALAMVALTIVRRLVRIPGLSKYSARLGAITFALAVVYFPVALGCILINQWCSGQLLQHNRTLYSKDELSPGNLALSTHYTKQAEVDSYVERSYSYKRDGSDAWGNPIYVDRVGERHVDCSMSYGDAEGGKVKVTSFDCP